MVSQLILNKKTNEADQDPVSGVPRGSFWWEDGWGGVIVFVVLFIFVWSVKVNSIKMRNLKKSGVDKREVVVICLMMFFTVAKHRYSEKTYGGQLLIHSC